MKNIMDKSTVEFIYCIEKKYKIHVRENQKEYIQNALNGKEMGNNLRNLYNKSFLHYIILNELQAQYKPYEKHLEKG